MQVGRNKIKNHVFSWALRQETNALDSSLTPTRAVKTTLHSTEHTTMGFLPKLSWRQQVVLPLLQVLELEIETWADHATLKEKQWYHHSLKPLKSNEKKWFSNECFMPELSACCGKRESTYIGLTLFSLPVRLTTIFPALWSSMISNSPM